MEANIKLNRHIQGCLIVGILTPLATVNAQMCRPNPPRLFVPVSLAFDIEISDAENPGIAIPLSGSVLWGFLAHSKLRIGPIAQWRFLRPQRPQLFPRLTLGGVASYSIEPKPDDPRIFRPARITVSLLGGSEGIEAGLGIFKEDGPWFHGGLEIGVSHVDRFSEPTTTVFARLVVGIDLSKISRIQNLPTVSSIQRDQFLGMVTIAMSARARWLCRSERNTYRLAGTVLNKAIQFTKVDELRAEFRRLDVDRLVSDLDFAIDAATTNARELGISIPDLSDPRNHRLMVFALLDGLRRVMNYPVSF